MQPCIYYNPKENRCNTYSGVAAQVSTPPRSQTRDYCLTDRFRACERYRAFHEHLTALVAKEDSLFLDPGILPRAALLNRARQLARSLSPKPQYESEIQDMTNRLFLDQLQSIYRENFSSDVTLKREEINDAGSLAVRTSVVWQYEVHNLSDSEVRFYIPFKATTFSFEADDVELSDHIEVDEVAVSVGDSEDWIHLEEKFELSSVPVVRSPPMKVKLDLTGKAYYSIPSKGFLRAHVKYTYLNRISDHHLQRMNNLTRNFWLELHYSDSDFSVQVEDFCLPVKNERVTGHSFEWLGWFIPFHGVVIEWEPNWTREPRLEERIPQRGT